MREGSRRLEGEEQALVGVGHSRGDRILRTLAGVFVDMRSDGLAVDCVLRDAVLIAAHGRNNGEGTRVDLRSSIGHDTDYDLEGVHHRTSHRQFRSETHLLPPFLTPRLTPLSRNQMLDILHDTAHGPKVKNRSSVGILELPPDPRLTDRTTPRPRYTSSSQ